MSIKYQRCDFARKGSSGPSPRPRGPRWLAPLATVACILLGMKAIQATKHHLLGQGPQGLQASAAKESAAAAPGTRAAFRGSKGGAGPKGPASALAASPQARLELRSPFRHYPESDTLSLAPETYRLRYAADTALQQRLNRYLRSYRPDHAVVLLCDLQSGRILAVGEKDDSAVSQKPALAFAGGFPAASLAKILTAAAAFENNSPLVEAGIPVVGSYYTLYRSQLRAEGSRWAKRISLEEAFAKSVNPAFALLGASVGPQALREMGNRLGFNTAFMPESRCLSTFTVPDSGYHLAEISCGFTRTTTITPLHALGIARAAGDDGRLRLPLFSEEVAVRRGGDWQRLENAEERPQPFLRTAPLSRLQDLMEATVKTGTARKGFRQALRQGDFETLSIGGKTGSLDGDSPKGRYDWFIGYAKDKEDPARGLALCVMLVHHKRQAVRSTQLAGLLVRDWLLEEKKVPRHRVAQGGRPLPRS